MLDIFTIMKFTMKDMLKRKSFIVSTIIILVMIVIGFNIPNIINTFNGEPGDLEVVISDRQNVFEGKLEVVNNSGLGYKVKISNDTLDVLREKIKKGDINTAIYVEKKDNNIDLKCIVENMMFSASPSEEFANALSSLYKNIQISKLDLTEEQMISINPTFTYSMEQTEEEANGNVIAMMLMSVVLFYAVYFCAFQVSSSITTEKTSKIIETLVTSTSPRNIVLGKTIGIGVVGLLQLICILATAYVSAKCFLDKALLESILDVSSLTLSLGLITLLYFILGYFTFAFLYALTGSTVSKPEDVQSANSPVALITVAGFYLSYFTMMNPGGDLNRLAALIPISSPFCMPFRIMMGLTDPVEVTVSILVLIVTIIVIANATIRIYSNAILNYGTKLSFKDIINMYKQK